MTEQDAIMNYMRRNDLMSFAPTAALIDMDGTLYDSMGHHADAWHHMMSEIGIDCDREMCIRDRTSTTIEVHQQAIFLRRGSQVMLFHPADWNIDQKP